MEDKNIEKAIDDIFDEDKSLTKDEELSKTALNINVDSNDVFDYSKVQDELQINYSNENSNENVNMKNENDTSLNIDNIIEKEDKVLNFINDKFEENNEVSEDNTAQNNNEVIVEDNNETDKEISDINIVNKENDSVISLENNNDVNIENSDESSFSSNLNNEYYSSSYDTSIELEDNKTRNNKKIFYLSMIALLIILLIIVLSIISINCEKNTVCTYALSNKNFKITDKYNITYKKNKILYLNGEYNYVAKTEEFKKQISNIKQEKKPIYKNSDGVRGFYYGVSEGDWDFNFVTSLDFTSFDYDEIDKIDQKVSPISIFNISSDLTYSKVKDELEKQGFTCEKA